MIDTFDHEAAHLALATVLGCEVLSVTIDARGGLARNVPAMCPQNEAVIAAAGFAAERLAGFHPSWGDPRYQYDRDKIDWLGQGREAVVADAMSLLRGTEKQRERVAAELRRQFARDGSASLTGDQIMELWYADRAKVARHRSAARTRIRLDRATTWQVR